MIISNLCQDKGCRFGVVSKNARSLLQHLSTVENATRNSGATSEYATSLLSLLEAVREEAPAALLVMLVASIPMLAYYGIITPYHQLVSPPTMKLGELVEGMAEVHAAYSRVLKKEAGAFKRLVAECRRTSPEESVETSSAVKTLRPWLQKLSSEQQAKLDAITTKSMKRSLEKIEKEQKKLEPVSSSRAPETVICATSRKAESVFGTLKQMEKDHDHLELRRTFVQAQSKVRNS